MRAFVIRHGKVDFQWKKWSTSEQFNKDCQMYDEAPLCASVISNKKLPLIFWNISARLQWFFNRYKTKEPQSSFILQPITDRQTVYKEANA